MGRLSNSLNMLLLLSNNRKYTIKELAERLEVSSRMVRFYKEEFEKAGIFIETIRGPYGGYVLKEAINIPPCKISKNDIDLLKAQSNENLVSLIDKLESIYIKDKETNNVVIDERDKYNVFAKANNNKNKVEIEYISPNDNVKTRIIYPLDMFLYKGGWCISGYCELRKEIRNFELKRILKYKILDEKFQ